MTDLEKLATDAFEAMKVSTQAKVDAKAKSAAKDSAISESQLADTSLASALADARAKANLYFDALEA